MVAEASWARLVAKIICGNIKEKAVELLLALSRVKLFAEGLREVIEDINIDINLQVFRQYHVLEKTFIRSPLVKLANRYMRSLTALSMYYMKKSEMEELVKDTFAVDDANTVISQFHNCKVVVFRN